LKVKWKNSCWSEVAVKSEVVVGLSSALLSALID